jgi:acyl-CoA synthetase (AMP-forming)/AMP-acid ligase II/acyl carrier protein
VAVADLTTLCEVLAHRARENAEETAYEFVSPGGAPDRITYRRLLERAVATARSMPAADGSAPVLILYPPGIDYVVALWACVVAGRPAVPTYPPMVRTDSAVTDRLAHMLRDIGSAAVLAPSYFDLDTGSGAARFDVAETGDASDWSPRGASPGDIAIVQYTSGSTKSPKGVVLTHHNVLSNVAAITSVFGLDESSRAFVWLPPYHDMGLIGGILTPLYNGFPVRLMSPIDFLKQPMSWLEQVSDFGATVSGGPNFAYELVLRKHRGDAAGLDLSRWRVAFNGAEPVRERTMARFAEAFTGTGFRAGSFLPCYGLAEATLLVTGAHWQPAETGQTTDDALSSASSGVPAPGHEVVIVERDGDTPVEDGAEGEICVRGPSVSPGYWTGRESFAGNGSGRLLRTGDLGRLRAGELYVTGRVSDVLIQRGRNYHAADVEEIAVGQDARLRPVAAAFTVEYPDAEARNVLVLERQGRVDAASVATDVRMRVMTELGLRLDEVLVLDPRAIPRTSSGKVRRAYCRTRYLAGEYTADPAGERALADLTAVITGIFQAVCELPLDENGNFITDAGGDSLKAAEIAAILERAAGYAVPLELLFDAPTPKGLASRLLPHWQRMHGVAPAAVLERVHATIAEQAR